MCRAVFSDRARRLNDTSAYVVLSLVTVHGALMLLVHVSCCL